ncbi:putative membrane protein YdjX (TVP38/TMEM64 family) [Actinomycetospora succinea]|uniref:TVP38/TMEM64 family membrane protein n=1 Tax=Actinomycetospora succinea TaxID=663603 RepID=A0A4R6UZP7_9PSEU|nr:TVP38/TMEM64 family protein [Actinomycetospora succinea]TDQ51796.1 putative membrane protein YdjX (TVP38/TMEM64 family) [Actinomycetospora succinea]
MAPLRLSSGPARWFVLAAVLLALVVLALTVPVPTPLELRDRVAALGAWAPMAFLLVHTVAATTPVPRTAFSLSAGLLFGPWTGLTLCLVASVVSAAAGFAISRRLGGRAVERLGPGRVRMLEERLSSRGLLAVVSARFVPFIPFAPLNYTFGVTSVRWRHYLVGTAIGLVPGTSAVVLLGDAATGSVSPSMLAVFVVSGTLGVIGVALCARTPAADTAEEA